MKTENRSESSKRQIFVHADLDLYGLDPYQFRLYAHIARRGDCYSKLKNIAKICKMSVRKAQYALKDLEDMGLIQKTARKGKTDIYQLAPREHWKERKQDDEHIQAEQEKVNNSLLNKNLIKLSRK